MPKKSRPLLERLMEKVRVTDAGCWEWTAWLRPDGYGQLSADASSSTRILAHRASYLLLVGQIPAGLQIDHLCRNRKCVNPAHLEPVTALENILRGEAPSAKNARKTSCNYGHPLCGDNLIIRKNGRRRCRACHIAAKRAARVRAKAGAK